MPPLLTATCRCNHLVAHHDIFGCLDCDCRCEPNEITDHRLYCDDATDGNEQDIHEKR